MNSLIKPLWKSWLILACLLASPVLRMDKGTVLAIHGKARIWSSFLETKGGESFLQVGNYWSRLLPKKTSIRLRRWVESDARCLLQTPFTPLVFWLWRGECHVGISFLESLQKRCRWQNIYPVTKLEPKGSQKRENWFYEGSCTVLLCSLMGNNDSKRF